MLKKWMAALLAMVMALSCTAAFAEGSKQTKAQLYFNDELLHMFGLDGELLDAFQTVADAFNGMSWTVTEGENVWKCNFVLNEHDIYDCTVVVDGGAVQLFSSLFPNSVLKLDLSQLGTALAKVFENEHVQQLLNEVQVQRLVEKEALMAAVETVLNALPAYAEDFAAVEQMVNEATVVNEAGDHAHMAVTTHHVADLGIAWLNRLQADEAVMAAVNELVAFVAEVNDEEAVDAAAFVAQLLEELQELKAEEAQEIAALDMYAWQNGMTYALTLAGEELGALQILQEAGCTTLELTVADTLLVSVDIYESEGMNCIDLLLIMAAYGTDDWQATYEGVLDGSNYYDLVLGLNMAADDEGYEAAQLYKISAGTTTSLLAEAIETGVGTAEWTEEGYISLDITEGEEKINIGGLAWESRLVETLEAPATDDKYVLDVLAFPLDLLLNGLPKQVEKLKTAAPEFMQLCEMLFDEYLSYLVPAYSSMTLEEEATTEIIVVSPPAENSVKTGIEDM